MSKQSLCPNPDFQDSWENALAREPQLCWQNWILGFEAGQFPRSPRGVDRIVAYGFCAQHSLKLAALLSAMFLCSNSAVFGNLPQALYTVSWKAGYTIVTVQSTPLTAELLRITEAVQGKILPLVIHYLRMDQYIWLQLWRF